MSIFPQRSRFRRRNGRCYELSYKTLLDLRDAGHADAVTLVHGTIETSLGTIGHAWLESDDEVYDAVLHTTMAIDQYIAKYGAVAERRLSVKEASVLAVTEKHFGPWQPPSRYRAHR